ncbi:hypothetical protein [Phytoactinopolyspora halotolerans]|uniref:Uncharacterized protein n=1 Tax=Phytoactinopolyspora halotolerans TaxID=1981512 RepID=A0A6L9S9L2_9ACTN|nr:hypothetical protein [Phytoactinopolyspora halotolerans]NEE01208.1 hypothetical protein [Phytoactinopolyspora halotolerans]
MHENGGMVVAYRPDVTAVITLDELGDATAVINGTGWGQELVVDRADAWTRLVELATEAGRPLHVHTVDEHGRAYRDVVHPKPSRDMVDGATSYPRAARDDEADEDERLGHTAEPPRTSVDGPPPAGATLSGGADVAKPDGHAVPQSMAADASQERSTALVAPKSEEPDENDASGDERVGSSPLRLPKATYREAVTAGGGHRDDSHDWAAPVVACAMLVLLACTAVMVAAEPPTVARAQKHVSTVLGSDTTSPPDESLPGYPRALWRVDLAEETCVALTRSGLLAVHTAAGRIQLVHSATGTVVWSSEAGTGAGSPVVTRWDDTDVVVWQRRGELVVGGPAFGPDPLVFDVNERARISQAGGQVLVSVPNQTGDANVLTAAGSVRVGIPDGATAMGVVNDVVVSSDGRPVLWRNPVHGGKPESVSLDGPRGMVIRRWVGMAGDTVTVVWGEPEGVAVDGTAVVAVHDATTGRRVASARVAWNEVEDAELTAASGDRPASVALGPVVLPLDSHSAPVEDDTTWLSHVGPNVWGVRDDGIVVVYDEHGTVNVVPEATHVPAGATPDGALIVVDDDVAFAFSPSSPSRSTRSADLDDSSRLREQLRPRASSSGEARAFLCRGRAGL